MPEQKVIIGSAQGLHARTAAIVVRAAARQPVPVTIGIGDRPPVPAASILGVLSLGAAHGAEVTLRAGAAGEAGDADGDEGGRAARALAELAALLASDLDAGEPAAG